MFTSLTNALHDFDAWTLKQETEYFTLVVFGMVLAAYLVE